MENNEKEPVMPKLSESLNAIKILIVLSIFFLIMAALKANKLAERLLTLESA